MIHICDGVQKSEQDIDIWFSNPNDRWILKIYDWGPMQGVSAKITYCPFCGVKLAHEDCKEGE